MHRLARPHKHMHRAAAVHPLSPKSKADETQHRAQERRTRALDTIVAADERDRSSGGPHVIALVQTHVHNPGAHALTHPSVADAGGSKLPTTHDAGSA